MSSLLNEVVRRLRSSGSVFEDRISKTTTMLIGDAYTKLRKPNALVAAVYENVMYSKKILESAQTHDEIVRLRGFSLAGYFDVSKDLRSTDPNEFEVATEQLIARLVNWVPFSGVGGYGPAIYEGMRIVAGDQSESVFTWSFIVPQTVAVDCLNQSEEENYVSSLNTDFTGFGIKRSTRT